MRISRVLVVLAALVAIAAPVAAALGFNDYFKPPNGIQGTPYQFQFQARAGCEPVYYYSLYRGSLPPGLTLSRSGRISGAPTTPGVYQFTAQLESYYQGCTSYPSQRDFTIEIAPTFGVVGVPYSVKFAASEGGKQTWSIYSGQPPPGLSFAPDGTLSGTPTTVGSYSWRVRLNDADTHQVTQEVVTKLAPSATGKAGELGVALSVKLATTGGKKPYTWTKTEGTLPAGVALTGDAISGTPRAAGSFRARFTVTDALKQTATVNVSLVVHAKVAVKTLHLAPTTIGKPYRATLRTAGGVGPFRWKVTSGRFPVGVRLDRTTGLLTGRAHRAGIFPLTLTVKDSLRQTSKASLILTVNALKRKK